ncbi:MAG: hypothetical protein M3Y08_19365, partial [Fibrobacterota bacterium]|nr:hypothetical protein [Fibrobacterota bacterium]
IHQLTDSAGVTRSLDQDHHLRLDGAPRREAVKCRASGPIRREKGMSAILELAVSIPFMGTAERLST